MTFKEYQEKSKRTMASLGSDNLDLAHMILGLSSEFSELMTAVHKEDDVNIGEEICDAEFYLTNYFSLRGYDFSPMQDVEIDLRDYGTVGTQGTLLHLAYKISELSDLVKKKIAYNKDIEVTKEMDILTDIQAGLVALTEFYSIDLAQALQNNVDKLLVRFPLEEGFTENAAKNRDLEAELKELKK